MRVSSDHYAQLHAAIAPIDIPNRREDYKAGKFYRAELVKDIDRRYRWDLLWASGAASVLYDAGYNDDHIDTALRSIVPPL